MGNKLAMARIASSCLSNLTILDCKFISPNLACDLTNHNAKSAILFDKQTRQESRLPLVDINLKNGLHFYKIIIFISKASVVIIL